MRQTKSKDLLFASQPQTRAVNRTLSGTERHRSNMNRVSANGPANYSKPSIT